MPQKERRQVIEVLASWSALFVGMMQARQYIVPMQEELIRRIREIRRLASPAGENASAGESVEAGAGAEAEADPASDPRQETDRQERLRQGVIPAGASAGFRTPGRDEKPLRQEGRAGMRFHAEKASSPENPP